jgi:hypothetical protein
MQVTTIDSHVPVGHLLAAEVKNGDGSIRGVLRLEQVIDDLTYRSTLWLEESISWAKPVRLWRTLRIGPNPSSPVITREFASVRLFEGIELAD